MSIHKFDVYMNRLPRLTINGTPLVGTEFYIMGDTAQEAEDKLQEILRTLDDRDDVAEVHWSTRGPPLRNEGKRTMARNSDTAVKYALIISIVTLMVDGTIIDQVEHIHKMR